MMSNERTALDMPAFDDDLDDFAPQQRKPQSKKAIDAISKFPSREGSTDGQISLKGSNDILDRFKQLCKDDRRTYCDMLEILMDDFEKGRG